MVRIPSQVFALLDALATQLPVVLGKNLIGIYLYGSLTQAAFNPKRSDIDCIVVTERVLSEAQLRRLRRWLSLAAESNHWALVQDGHGGLEATRCQVGVSSSVSRMRNSIPFRRNGAAADCREPARLRRGGSFSMPPIARGNSARAQHPGVRRTDSRSRYCARHNVRHSEPTAAEGEESTRSDSLSCPLRKGSCK